MAWRRKHGFVRVASVVALAIVVLAPSLVLGQVDPKPDKSVKIDMASVKLAAGAATPISQLPSPPANGEMAFVFSDFSAMVYPGWDSCPTGWSRTNKEEYLSTVSPAERARTSIKKENEPELTTKWKASTNGPDNTNVCTNYDKFPDRPLQSEVQSKIAYGLSLDGTEDGKPTDPYFCPHEKFTSPLGEKGIDNQAYRADGCARIYRGSGGTAGEVIPITRGQLAGGQFTIVMILRGVTSLVNDDDVEVILASSDQQPIIDTQQRFIQNASFNVSDNPRWRNVLHGKIVNGVLTTESKDILLVRSKGERGMKPKPGAGSYWDWDFERGKLKLAFRPDGTLEGILGGYEAPVDRLHPEIGGGRGTAQIGGIDCAAMYNALMKSADGGRDPATGKCTRDSAAYRITAAPAFVFDHPPQAKTAALTDGRE